MFDSTEDLDDMFDLADFAETVRFTLPDPSNPPNGTMTVDVSAYFDRNVGESAVYDRSFFDEKFYSAIVETGKDYLTIPTHRVPATVKRNTPVLVRGVAHFVFRAPYNGGEGLSAIFISKDLA